eukprot:COSAG01_NODE_550_length_15593_cov_12.422422_11_plen_417_part_00
MCRVLAFQRRTANSTIDSGIPTVIARPAAAAAPPPSSSETAAVAAAGTVPPQPCAPPPSSSETTGSAAAGTVPPQPCAPPPSSSETTGPAAAGTVPLPPCAPPPSSSETAGSAVAGTVPPPCAPPPSSSETTGSAVVAPGYDQRFFDMLARAKYVFDCTIQDKKTPARTLVAICWRVAFSVQKDARSNTQLTAPPVPLCLQEGWSQHISECEIQPEEYYTDEHTRAARQYILDNLDSASFQAQFQSKDYITKPLGAGGKKTGLACAICVACSDWSHACSQDFSMYRHPKVPNMLYSARGRAYGSMQVNSGQTDTHFRCQKHHDNVRGLSQIQSSHRTREERNKRSGKQFTEAAKRSSVSGDASGNQRILRSRTMDALITVIGGRWRDVWNKEKQRYYNLGYEDCSKGGQKRKFTRE